MQKQYTKEEIKNAIITKLKRVFGKTLEEATPQQVYKACAMRVNEMILEKWTDANMQVAAQGLKRVYYLSAEFLMGRALTNNMVNLGIIDEYREVLQDLGLNLDDIEEEEQDAGLGNGGLGRLAACFLDSLSTLDLPATGCSIRYEQGLFRQRIEDGEQKEINDNWLKDGNIWEVERPEEQVEVYYGGEVEEIWTKEGLRINYRNNNCILAIPYDYPVIGYESRMPATLRLWRARAKTELDMNYFNRGEYSRAVQERELAEVVSKCLYPEDNHEQGKQLRLKQFYFFTSATMQHIVRKHKANIGDLHTLPNYYAVQINDTHPTLAIPELMRILMDEEHMEWEDAYDIAHRMFSYTNHTIMAEALETWEEEMFRRLLPRLYRIIMTIDEKLRDELWKEYPGEFDKINSLAIVSHGEIRMANLCIVMCNKVNGVSALHGEILKSTTFRDFYVLYPEKFLSITNGITHRRWLAKSNPKLTQLLADYIGDDFIKDYKQMDRIAGLLDNQTFLDDFMQVKLHNKKMLCEHLKKTQGIELNPNSIFDVHAKRLHEYKRQLLKVIHILHLYNALKKDPGIQMEPCTFIFAGKAAPGYIRAKNIIRLILAVGELVNNDPDTKELLKVAFIENYNVSEAEYLMPAADISEQISTAGYEASGTGNMKFMMNGAVTLGTMDGANVEIFEAVGKDNIFIFGATADEISRVNRFGNYNPGDYYERNRDIHSALNRMVDGTLRTADPNQFLDIYRSLLFDGIDKADKYYLLGDFESYNTAFEQTVQAYHDKERWKRMAASNTAHSGIFCSDRTIGEYNEKIWKLYEMK